MPRPPLLPPHLWTREACFSIYAIWEEVKVKECEYTQSGSVPPCKPSYVRKERWNTGELKVMLVHEGCRKIRSHAPGNPAPSARADALIWLKMHPKGDPRALDDKPDTPVTFVEARDELS